jgi:type IV secretory pathway TraG/TraD family ATPase VirD4
MSISLSNRPTIRGINTTLEEPMMRKPQGLFPTDATTMTMGDDAAKYAAMTKDYYKRLRSMDPGFTLGIYPNTLRDYEEVYLEDRSDRFGGSMFPTRLGKGISFVIPNCFNWFQSLFVNDPKGENMYYTAWWRRYMMGQRIFVVNPYDTTGIAAKINLLDEVRERTMWEIQDAYNFATAVVDPDGKGLDEVKEGVWKKRSRDLLAGIILHIKWAREFKGKRSLSTCIDFATDPSTPFEEKLQRMKVYAHDPDFDYDFRDVYGNRTATHPFISAKIQQQLDRPEAEAGSVKSEYESYLSLYQENLARINTTESDFSVLDAMDGIAPSTIYMWINPQNAKTAMPFVRLFFNLLINRNLVDIEPDPVTGRPKRSHDWKLGMLLDEFTSVFGKLDVFAQQLAFIAGYGFKPWVIVQDKTQIEEQYTQLENVTSNLHTLTFGTMTNMNSARFFSEIIGEETYWQAIRSGMGKPSESSNGRKLFSPDQIMRVHQDEAIMRVAGHNIAMIRKLKHFREESGYAGKVVPFVGEHSDKIPFDRQRTQINRLKLENEYKEFCRTRGRDLRSKFLEMSDGADTYVDQLTDLRRRTKMAAMERDAA